MATITTWTTPRDWAVDELTTEAMMDTHVRDNLKHCYEKSSLKVYTDSDTSTDTISNATVTASSCTVSVVVDYVSDIFVWCNAGIWHSTSGDVACWLQGMRDTTGIGLKMRNDGDDTRNKNHVTSFALDESVAAGTYDYSVGFYPNGGSGDANVDYKSITVLVIPQHG